MNKENWLGKYSYGASGKYIYRLSILAIFFAGTLFVPPCPHCRHIQIDQIFFQLHNLIRLSLDCRGLGHAGPSGKTCRSKEFSMTGGGFHHGKLGSKLKYLPHVLHGTGRFTYIYHKFEPNVNKYSTHGTFVYMKFPENKRLHNLNITSKWISKKKPFQYSLQTNLLQTVPPGKKLEDLPSK